MWNQRSIKKYGTSTGTHCMAEEARGETETKTKDSRWTCPGDECWWTGSDNMWRLSRLHGFLFWGILCCKFFFSSSSSLYFCTTRKQQDGKHYQRLKERTNTQRYFPERRFSQSARFFFFPFFFSTNSFPLFWHSGRQQSKSCKLDLQRTNEVDR